MKLLFFTFFCLTLFLNSSNEEHIQGKWKMHKVFQNNDDVTYEHNPQGTRYITLNKDGTFESGGDPVGQNTGKYTFNEEKNQLFLDSYVGPEDDSYWIVTIKNDTMHWQGYGSKWAEGFEIIHVRDQ